MRFDQVHVPRAPRRICIVYDCLYPYTVGGAERWYRNLGEALITEGHCVTFLTLRQWPKGEKGVVPNAAVVAVGPRLALYGTNGQRRVLPPLVFGFGVMWHLLRHGGRYDACILPLSHTSRCSRSVFCSQSTATGSRWIGRVLVFRLLDALSRQSWRAHRLDGAGALPAAPAACVLLSRTHRGSPGTAGFGDPARILRGLCERLPDRREPAPADPVIVFAGRHIPEKRVATIVPALARARAQRPDLRACILGDGPSRAEILNAVALSGLAKCIEVPGFVSAEAVSDYLSRALCLIHPSEREGYGLVVVEAAALGTPTILVRGVDNAATELIEDGINGFVVDSASPQDLADAILRSRGGRTSVATVDSGLVRPKCGRPVDPILTGPGCGELRILKSLSASFEQWRTNIWETKQLSPSKRYADEGRA